MNSLAMWHMIDHNRKIEAKEQAHLDKIYYDERVKLGLENVQPQQQCDCSQSNNISSEILERLNKIEKRLDRLENNVVIQTDDKVISPFVCCTNSKVKTKVCYQLTDAQFQELLKAIYKIK